MLINGTRYKVRPILYNTEMAQAILDGRKTQTRRAIKSQPTDAGLEWIETVEGFAAWQDPCLNLDEHSADGGPCQRICPYGRPGDVLWVRETWQSLKIAKPIKAIPDDYKQTQYIYKADGDVANSDGSGFNWRPSIHMPREAARLFLLVTNVRVERLQDITEEDVEREGLTQKGVVWEYNYYRDSFITLWDGIYGKKHPWDSNPWVWVLEFERVAKEREGFLVCSKLHGIKY